MKVIELLMQGNKVWNKDKEGYFELDQRRNRLYFTDINTKRRKTYPQIVLELALREGEIYTETDWKKVPLGTKVRVWDYDNESKEVGRFLCYKKNYEGDEFPFLVFIESEKNTYWFKYCEIIKEDE